MFFLVKKKIAWSLFAVVFIGLWFARDDLGNYGWMYLATAGLSLFMMWQNKAIGKMLRRLEEDEYATKRNRNLASRYRMKRIELEEEARKLGGEYVSHFADKEIKGREGWDYDDKYLRKTIIDLTS